jgi:magnesium transporter
MRVALLNGGTVALILGIGVAAVFGNPLLGGVIAVAMLANILVAGTVGSLVPLTLERMGVDPAVGSSVFVTMMTDSMGFLIFLGLAVMSGLA